MATPVVTSVSAVLSAPRSTVNHTVARALKAEAVVVSYTGTRLPLLSVEVYDDTTAIVAWTNFEAGKTCNASVRFTEDEDVSVAGTKVLDVSASGTSTDENVTISSASERGISIERTGDLGDTNPKFEIGRIVEGGVNRAVLRILQSADGVAEHSCAEFEGTGTIASVAEAARASHFEAFMATGVTEPTFRLNSYPDMQLQLGPGGQKVAIGGLSRTGSTVTGTTADNHKFGVGDTVTISPGEANFAAGDYTITAVPDATTFQYSNAGSAVVSTAVQYASVPVDVYIRRNGRRSLDIGFGEDSKVVFYDDSWTFQAGVKLVFDKGNSSGTPGAAEINKQCGISKVANGQASLVITNSLVSATSIVLANLLEADGAIHVLSVVPGSGSFTINMSAAVSADRLIGWMVVS